MIHPALKEKKLVFDVEGKPELAKAIVARLVELGAKDETKGFSGNQTNNVSFGYYGERGAALGALPWNTPGWFEKHHLSTLSGLYDLPEAPALRLEVGKRYRSNDGYVTQPMRHTPHGARDRHPFTDGSRWYSKTGERIDRSKPNSDLIEEVTGYTITLEDGRTVVISEESYKALAEAVKS